MEKKQNEKEQENEVKQVPTNEKEKDQVKKKNKKIITVTIICAVVIVVCLLGIVATIVLSGNNKEKNKVEKDKVSTKSELRISGNGLEDFDLYFLQLENDQTNKIYSPLSIKYALAMLNEGTEGESHEQIKNIIGDYKAKKYNNNEHMSFANAIFVRNTFKEKIKEEYTTSLSDKYNAEVVLDDFASPDNINNWVSNRTFNLVNNLLDDVSNNDFFLINALAIDMNWNNQLQCEEGRTIPCLRYYVYYNHEEYRDYIDEVYKKFEEINFNGKNVEAAKIGATINKYDIINELGEDNIRNTVGSELKEYINKGGEMCDETYDSWMNTYIKELGENYKRVDQSTDFYVYDDENVKVFAKDLTEYDGVTLQYVGIMPVSKSLDTYVKEVDAKQLNKIISNLKDIKFENFKDGVVTKINGSIPFFNYDYELRLQEDLEKLGIKDVFNSSKANLSGIVDEEKEYIEKAIHKANIKFSNDGIKASAATALGGGLGAAGACYIEFDHVYEVPVEEIDLTFDKPYMYIIRDKATGEVWFTGTVYNPA